MTIGDDAGLTASDSVTVTVTTPPVIPTARVELSSPADVSLLSNESDSMISWLVTYYHVAGLSWTFLVNGQVNQTGFLDNNTIYNFNVSALGLSGGSHNLTFQLELEDFKNDLIFVQDTALAHVTVVQVIEAGITDIDLTGILSITISLTLDDSVEVVIIPSSEPSNETREAAILLEEEGFAFSTVFLDIEISNTSALENIWINISYADWDLVALELEEASLKIVFYNETKGIWEDAGLTGVDIDRKVIFARIDHLTDFAAISIRTEPKTGTIISTLPSSISSIPSITPNGTFGFEMLVTMIALGIAIPIQRLRKYKDN